VGCFDRESGALYLRWRCYLPLVETTLNLIDDAIKSMYIAVALGQIKIDHLGIRYEKFNVFQVHPQFHFPNFKILYPDELNCSKIIQVTVLITLVNMPCHKYRSLVFKEGQEPERL